MGSERILTLALPSKGQLERPTLDFLRSCGLAVERTNPRQYVAKIPALPRVRILFQRTTDIVRKVEDGTVDLGVTGFDVVREKRRGGGNCLVLVRELGYGACRLVLAVPKSWIDVVSVADVADLASLFREQHRELRISTKYPNLTRRWLYERGIFHFGIVDAEGAHEAAPAMGYADLIVDVSSTGTTLEENGLKLVRGGTLLESQACLIGNRRPLGSDPGRRALLRLLLERLEAHLRSRRYVSVTANMQAHSPEQIAGRLRRRLPGAGLRGPTVSRVYPEGGNGGWFAITLIVDDGKLMDTVDGLRQAGASEITVSHPAYVFEARSRYYQGFLELCRNREKEVIRRGV